MQLDINAVIPDAQLEAAAEFGKLVAMGLGDLRQHLQELLQALQPAGYRGDMSHARTTLACAIRNSAEHCNRVRRTADQAIRRRIASLMRERAPGSAIFALAWEENEALNAPFTLRQVLTICQEEAAWWIRWHQRNGRNA